MIELGEAENARAWLRKPNALKKPEKKEVARPELRQRCCRAKPTGSTPISKSMPARRYKPGLASMLLRMYTRWAEKHGFKIEYLEEDPGRRGRPSSRPPSSSAAPCLWLAETEAGVHRLVRIFAIRFQTRAGTPRSPASAIFRWSQLDQDRYRESDVRVDTMLRAAPGGQHVNKTEFRGAVDAYSDRVAVVWPGRRWPAQDKAQAWDMLRARL